MYQNRAANSVSNFRQMAFSRKVWRCLERAERGEITLRWDDRALKFALLAKARQTMDIADDQTVELLLNKNPFTIQALTGGDGGVVAEGLLAILPLTESGYGALINGHFDGKRPLSDWICCPGEPPVALYVWLVFMPMTFGRLLGAIAHAIEPLMVAPCPIFSRSTSEHSARLHATAGFKPATAFFPDCQPDLLVSFPEAELVRSERPQPEIAIARSVEEIFKVFSVRSATYIAEQFCHYDEEFDGNDFCATHFLGTVDGDAAGCVRLRFFNDFAKLERLAVRAEYRQSKLAYQLVRTALKHCAKKGYRKILGHSRADLVRFWRTFGFVPIEGRPQFSFANVRYTEILLEQVPDYASIQISADPMAIIRPEGAWHIPGPFDLGLSAHDPRRKRLLEKKSRTVHRQNILA